MKERCVDFNAWITLDQAVFLQQLADDWATNTSDVLRTILDIYRRKHDEKS